MLVVEGMTTDLIKSTELYQTQAPFALKACIYIYLKLVSSLIPTLPYNRVFNRQFVILSLKDSSLV